MALFIVLWLMNANSRVKQMVGGYFQDPVAFNHKIHGSMNPGEGLLVDQAHIQDVRKVIEQSLRMMPEFPKIRDNVKLVTTTEGLRIDLMETESGLFFVTGSASPTQAGEHLLRLLAEEITRMSNPLVIEGHTDATPFRNEGPDSTYGNWELSADRANAARRLLQSYGVPPQQVTEVRGFASHKLLDPKAPTDPRNRRVSLVMRFNGGQGQ